jgi:hypothetical protein
MEVRPMSNLPNDGDLSDLSVEEILRIDRELLERIDAKLAELRKMKASHALTVAPEGRPDHWTWVCSCGDFTAVQYPPGVESAPIGTRLLGHVREAYQ